MSLEHSPTRQTGNGSQIAALADPTLTITEFCAAEKISRTALYKMWAEGKGPRWFNNGTKRLISYEARQEWRRAREAEAAAADDGVAA
jgi:hypothetical protein